LEVSGYPLAFQRVAAERSVRRQTEVRCMNLKAFRLRLALMVVIAGVAPAIAAESPVADPPNGLQAQTLGATRLAGEDAGKVKIVSRAPLAQFYPREAAIARIPGRIVLDLLIDMDGNVKDVVVLDESPLGYGFGDAAIAAARTYKFANPYNKLVILKIVIPASP
jgi:TonB family protein